MIIGVGGGSFAAMNFSVRRDFAAMIFLATGGAQRGEARDCVERAAHADAADLVARTDSAADSPPPDSAANDLETGDLGSSDLASAGNASDVRRCRMASAASLVRSLFSPAGPTHDGQPLSHGQASISSRVFCSSNSWTR